MTENKRFMLDDCGELIDLNNHTFVDYGDGVCNLLNELNDENKQLKSDNNRLINETAKIVAEHQGRVLDLIDEKINEYIYKEKLYKPKGKDREASVFNLYCLCLNNLKKELSE